MKFIVALNLCLASAFSTPARADAPSVHGMFVFGGEKATYASHLPMFHAPHDRQLILKIAFTPTQGSLAVERYEELKKKGHKFFTLEPQVMDLEKIATGSKLSFLSKIYDGHFERGGVSLGISQVNVQGIVLSTKLDGGISRPMGGKYWVFGESGETFAAHLIEGKPSFDAIIDLENPDLALPVLMDGPGTLKALERTNSLGGAGVKSILYAEEGDLSH